MPTLSDETSPQRQDYFDLWQEHRRLRLENMTLKARLDAVERLEALVGLRKRFEHHEWAAARVIAVGAGGVAPILTVDAGDESRVKVGDLAVDDRGVVGRVRSVSEGASEILPITDPMSLVGFRGEISGAVGMINGDGSGGLVAVGVDPGYPPVVGEPLLSRTLESTLPEGIPIGHVRLLETEETTGRLLVWITPIRPLRQVGPMLIAGRSGATRGHLSQGQTAAAWAGPMRWLRMLVLLAAVMLWGMLERSVGVVPLFGLSLGACVACAFEPQARVLVVVRLVDAGGG